MKTILTNQKNNLIRLTKVLGIAALISLGLKANSQCISNYTYVNDTINSGNIIFTNTSSIGNSALTYFWDFGDGTTSTLENPVHVFANNGTNGALVCLTVADLNGTTCTICDSVSTGTQTWPGCQAMFYSEPDSALFNSINFFNYSGEAPTSFYWEFGDGTTSTLENPNHIFADSGLYQVCLTIVDSIGATCSYCESVNIGNPDDGGCQAYFYSYADSNSVNSINFWNYSSGTSTTFYWEFGDGTTSTLENPNHVFAAEGTYQVCLTIGDSTGVTCSYCETIVVGQNGNGCQAYFYSYADSADINTINFWNYSGGIPVSYAWDFGDNTASALENPNHVFATAGIYYVCLTVTDSDGSTCSYCETIVVGQNGNGCQAYFYSYTDSSSTNLINFANYSSGPSDSYSWDFGDNTTSNLENPDHVYTANGVYQVCLTISDSTGITCTYCSEVVIGIPSGACQANFSLAVDSVDNAFFWVNDNSSCGNNGNGNCSYLWDFGDGTTSTMQYFATHTYSGDGPYYLCLTISDGNGCSDTYCDSVNLLGRSSGITIGIVNQLAGVNEANKISTEMENYPNPFSGSTTINYSISKDAAVELSIVDLLGNKIKAVESGNKSAGNYSTVWNAENVSNGMYLLQLIVNNQVSTKRIIVAK